jgi:hypothetical protein
MAEGRGLHPGSVGGIDQHPRSLAEAARGVAAALDEPLVPVDELDARPADLLEDDSAQLPEFAVSVFLPCAP